MSIKKLDNLLESGLNRRLKKLIRRARDMETLTTALRAALAEDLAENLLAANLHDDGLLVLVCSTPAWASRMRFETDAIMKIARSTGATVSFCQVKVSR